MIFKLSNLVLAGAIILSAVSVWLPQDGAVPRWEHEHILEEVQCRLDMNPEAMRTRRETVEHSSGAIKVRMGATHFLMKRLYNVKTEISLAVLAYNLTRVMNNIGIKPLIAAIRAFLRGKSLRSTCV